MMHKTHPIQHKGFTLAEVLIAIGIFTIGLVAIASLFPTAAILQKRTMDTVETNIASNNIKGMIAGFHLSSEALNNGTYGVPADVGYVYPVMQPIEFSFSLLALRNYLSLDDRSFPQGFQQLNQRDYFCVPFVKRGSATTTGVTMPRDWAVYMFVLKRNPNSEYPRGFYLNSPPDYFTVNEDEFGNYHDGNGAPLEPYSGDTNPDMAYEEIVPMIRLMPVTVVGPVNPVNNKYYKFKIDTSLTSITNDRNGDGIADCIVRGDMILDEHGNIHHVYDTDDLMLEFTVTGSIDASPLFTPPTYPTPVFPKWVWWVDRGRPTGSNSIIQDEVEDSPLVNIVIIKDVVDE